MSPAAAARRARPGVGRVHGHGLLAAARGAARVAADARRLDGRRRPRTRRAPPAACRARAAATRRRRPATRSRARCAAASDDFRRGRTRRPSSADPDHPARAHRRRASTPTAARRCRRELTMGLRDRIADRRTTPRAAATASPTTASACSRRSTSPSSRRCRSRSGARGSSASSGRMVCREGPVLTTAERTRLIRRVIDEAIGLGVLEPLLADPTVTEIMVNGIDEIFVERDGRIQRADISFSDEAQLYQTIDRIVSQVNRRVDESSPMVDARLPTGERVNVIIPPLALRGPTITIRRFPRLFTLEQLTAMGSIDRDVTGAAAGLRAREAQRRHLGRHRRGQDDAAQRAVGGRPARRADHHRRGQRRAAAPAAARRHARGAAARTSRAAARSRSATSCATRCACGPTGSSSARSAAARRSTCSRRSTRATRARS